MADEPETNPYELLGVGVEATDQEIKSAYRKLSLKVHPDRNPNNPDAARKFHELNQAYELLLDPLRRLAVSTSFRAKEARKARFAKHDAKRKNLQDELEERERAFKKQKVGKAKDAREREQENERIKEAGRKLREDREKELLRKQTEAESPSADTDQEEDEVPPLGQLDTTIKLKYPLASHPTLITATALDSLLAQFGDVDTASIVLSLKPPKKAPHKPPKFGTALVPFRTIGSAFAAVCAGGRKERGLGDVEVGWAGGSEPPILEWLKKKGKLNAESPEKSGSPSPPAPSAAGLFSTLDGGSPAEPTSATAFSSFPESFQPSSSETPAPKSSAPSLPGLDYESLTMMRLRQAEREKLEREIREQEANE